MSDDPDDRKARDALFTQMREDLAALEHEQWITWSKDIALTEVITEDRLVRWQGLWKDYTSLTEPQKDQDREWADRVISIIAPLRRLLEAAERERDKVKVGVKEIMLQHTPIVEIKDEHSTEDMLTNLDGWLSVITAELDDKVKQIVAKEPPYPLAKLDDWEIARKVCEPLLHQRPCTGEDIENPGLLLWRRDYDKLIDRIVEALAKARAEIKEEEEAVKAKDQDLKS